MNRTRTLPFVLDILDDGLRLYRRHLAQFALVATAVLVMLALIAISFMAFVRTQIGTTSGWTFLAGFVVLLIAYPIVLYGMGALSRTTRALLDGQPPHVLSALKLGPIRGCGMVLFNFTFAIISGIAFSTVGSTIACTLTYAAAISAGLLSTISSDFSAFGIALASGVSSFSFIWSLGMFGAWLASMVYALQTFVLERRSWSQSVGRSFDVMSARFGRSLLMFVTAGTTFGLLCVIYVGVLLSLFGLITDWLSLNLPPLVSDALIIAIVVASLVLLLPPLSIWMTLFYRRTLQEHDGDDLAQQISRWQTRIAAYNP